MLQSFVRAVRNAEDLHDHYDCDNYKKEEKPDNDDHHVCMWVGFDLLPYLNLCLRFGHLASLALGGTAVRFLCFLVHHAEDHVDEILGLRPVFLPIPSLHVAAYECDLLNLKEI